MGDFPKLIIKPGSYTCVLEHPDGRRITGQIELNASQSPLGEIFGWPPVPSSKGVTAYPQPDEHFASLKCDLRQGLEVLLLDVTVRVWFPERAHFYARHALVGHGLFSNPDRHFAGASVQITAGHRLFGEIPIISTLGPRYIPETGNVDFTARMSSGANKTYISGNSELRCKYWFTHSSNDYYQFRLATAPVFELENSQSSLSASDWLTRHLLPLRDLITLATLEPQTLAWVMLDESRMAAEEIVTQRDFQLFSSEVSQEPYSPTADGINDGRTLFTFSEAPINPVDLLIRWDELRQSHAAFIRPLMQGLTEKLSPQARFLFLVQALEGLHAKTVGEGPVTVAEHRKKRSSILKVLKDAGLEKEDREWANRWFDLYGRYSLAERLTQLRDAVQEEIEGAVDLSVMPGSIPEIRNNLSHGAKDYQWQDLLPQMRAMSAVGVAHILSLLGLPTDRLSRMFI